MISHFFSTYSTIVCVLHRFLNHKTHHSRPKRARNDVSFVDAFLEKWDRDISGVHCSSISLHINFPFVAILYMICSIFCQSFHFTLSVNSDTAICCCNQHVALTITLICRKRQCVASTRHSVRKQRQDVTGKYH